MKEYPKFNNNISNCHFISRNYFLR